MMTNLNFLLGVLSLITSGLSAVTAIKAQKVVIRNSQDDFIDDLRSQGKWSMWSSIFQAATFAVLFARLAFMGYV